MKKEVAVVLAIFCAIAFCVGPAAASAEDNVESVDIIVSSILNQIPQSKTSVTGYITQGETKAYNYALPAGETAMNAVVSWSDSSNNLGLTINQLGRYNIWRV